MKSSPEAVATVGLQAIAWLAGNDQLCQVFMGATGASEEDFRQQVDSPSFQAAVLDFLLMDDAWILAFCTEAGLDPMLPMQVRAQLPGGESVHWT